MNAVDLIVVVAALAFAWAGWRQGFVGAAISFTGFIAGGLLGAFLAPLVLPRTELSGVGALALSVAIVLGLACCGQVLTAVLGRRIQRRVVSRPARIVDHLGGAALNVAALLLMAWVLAVAAAGLPASAVATEVRASTVLTNLDRVVPDPARELVGQLRVLIDTSGLPQLFDSFGIAPPGQIEAPTTAIVSDPQVQRALKSVVRVEGDAPSCREALTGSGFVFASNRVLTNAHVVAGVKAPKVHLPGTATVYSARTVYFDPRIDVAVLQVPGLPAAALGMDSVGARGTDAIIAGYPGGGPMTATAARIRGTIPSSQATGTDIYGQPGVGRQIYVLRGTARPGNSGGPLIDLDGRVLDSNASLRSMVDIDADSLATCTYQQLSEPGDLRRETSMDESLRSGAIPGYVIDKRLMRHDGSTVWTRCHRSLVRDPEGRPISILTQAQDIRAERDAMEARDAIESELRRRTSYDQLTGIRNREAITEFLDHALGTGRRAGQGTAVLFIDVDDFKQINDGISHHAGDQVLAGVARVLEETLRSTDAVGRLGGDEFLAVLTELHTEDEADLAAGRIRERIAGCRIRVDEHVVSVTASIGLARAQESSTVDRLLREADSALHRAKRAGRNRIEVFDDSLRKDVEHRVRLHADLCDALDDGRIEAWFQPIVDLADESLTGYEALARWRTPDGAVVPAAKFIPLAEESKLIHPLGASVIGESLAQLELIPDPLTLSINASPSQLSSRDFTDTFERLLVCCDVEPSRVIVEITETQLLNLPGAAHVGMCRLADAGVRWQIDDFGTGYSSLSVLRDYPITGIKLDRSFTADLGRNPVPATMQIVGGIADLATRLGAMLIAEGIETPAQAATLRELGWTHGQGWLFGRPSPPQQRTRPGGGSHARQAGESRLLLGGAAIRPSERRVAHRS